MKWIKYLFGIIIALNAAQVQLNFKNLDIADFVKMVAKITHKNILLTQNVHGKVNFISVKPIDEKEVYKVLLDILKSKGYTIVEEQGFLKVIRNADAIKDAPPLAGKSGIDQIETDIITLNNIPVASAFKQVSYLLSRYGRIVINTEKNILIITDYADNLKIIKEILRKLDKQNRIIMQTIKFKHTDITRVFPKIKEIASAMYDVKIYKYKIVTNESTNSIIIVAPKRIAYALSTMIRDFDIKPKPLTQMTEVVTLKNSDATNIQKILAQIIKVKYKKDTPSITADSETNSLIVLATPEQLETIKTIIAALDVPKQQVYVKARILEISNSKALQVGTKLGLLAGSANSSGLYTMSANLGGPAIAIDTAGLNLDIPTIREGLALGATLDLLETYGAAKKLSEPSILCINNTPSTIYVGKTVSVLTGKTTSNATSVSYSRQNIGLTLKIKPRIDNDNKVALNIKAIVEDILKSETPDNTLPTTSKRDVETTTIVKNGQSVIIGGLVKDNTESHITKVPLLGDIPILGHLFQHKSKNGDRTTLAIVLTPYIIKKSGDLDKLRLTLAKLNELEKKFITDYLKKVGTK